MNAEAERLIQSMTAHGRIGQNMLALALKTALGRSIEAHGPHLSSLAARIAAEGADSPARARSHVGISAFAPPTGDPWHTALAVAGDGGVFVVCAELDGKPDPKIDTAIAEILGEDHPSVRAVPRPEELRKVSLFRVDAPEGAAAAVADAVADRWRPDMLLSRSFSIAPWADEPEDDQFWMDGVTNPNGAGIDCWPAAFEALRAALTAFGDGDRIHADAEVFRRRRFQETGVPDLSHHDAATAFGAQAAERDGYLPAAETRAAMTRLVDEMVARDVIAIADDLAAVHEACTRSGYVGSDRSYDFNDLSDHVSAGEAGGASVLEMRDARRRNRAEFRRGADGVSLKLFGDPAPDGSRPLLASIDAAGGKAAIDKGVGIEGDDIRTWNSFVAFVDSARCCLDEDYGAAPVR